MGTNMSDLHPAGYADEGKYVVVSTDLQHPIFGTISILKLASKGRNLNTHNPLILKTSESQQFMSIQTELTQQGLQAMLKGMLQLQQGVNANDKQFKEFIFLKLYEIGQQMQGKPGRKGIMFEYQEKNLQEVCLQRKQAGTYFSEGELWYILQTVASVNAGNKLLQVPFLEFILRKIPIYAQTILVTEDGLLKLSHHVIYLSNPQAYQNNYQQTRTEGQYKDLLQSINTVISKQEQKDQSSMFCGAVDQRVQRDKINVINPDLQDLSKSVVFQIGFLLISLAVMDPTLQSPSEEHIKSMQLKYSADLVQMVCIMIQEQSKRPSLNDLLMHLMQIKLNIKFASALNIEKAPVQFQNLTPQKEIPEHQYSVNQFESPADQVQPALKARFQDSQREQSQSPPKYASMVDLVRSSDLQQPAPTAVSRPVAVIDKNRIISSFTEQEIPQRNQIVIPIVVQKNLHTEEQTNQRSVTQSHYHYVPMIQQQPIYYLPQQVFYNPDPTLDDRVRLALNKSRQVLSGVGYDQHYYSRRSPAREYYEPRGSETYHFNYVAPTNEDFEEKFWRVIREAKQQVLQSEGGVNLSYYSSQNVI